MSQAAGLSRSPSFTSGLVSQGRVIRALMLRDIRTRFFGNGLGYIVAILWPLTHILILVSLYVFFGRLAPIGDSVTKFFAISVGPAIAFQYMSRFTVMSASQNKPLLAFPPVRIIDIVLARGALESACSVCVFVIIGILLVALDISLDVSDYFQLFLALFTTVFAGFAFGFVNALIAVKLPGWIIFVLLMNVLMYVTAGVVFMPDALPTEVLNILYYNPVLHSVEWTREAFFHGYRSIVLDKYYLLGFGVVCLWIGLAMEKLLRSFMLR